MKRNRRSFTLIEILITSSILTVIMVVIYSSFATGLFGFRNIEENISAYRSARVLLDRIDLDLRNSVIFSGDNTMFKGTLDGLSFLTIIDTFKDKNKLPELAYVSYDFNKDSLLRLERIGQYTLNNNADSKLRNIFKHISQIKFSYAYLKDSAFQWQDAWDNATLLPAAVKVELTLQYKAKYPFMRTIYLP